MISYFRNTLYQNSFDEYNRANSDNSQHDSNDSFIFFSFSHWLRLFEKIRHSSTNMMINIFFALPGLIRI